MQETRREASLIDSQCYALAFRLRFQRFLKGKLAHNVRVYGAWLHQNDH